MADALGGSIPCEELSEELYKAHKSGVPVAPLTERFAELTLAQAYEIQLKFLEYRLKLDAERVVGKKIGVTSRPVMDLFKVDQPDFGMLTSAMLREDGATLSTERLIAPKAEGEIAFLLKDDLVGPGVTAADVLRATEYVLPSLEIVDSRIRDWKIRIQDTVADNASSALFVLGDRAVSPRGLDLSVLGMTLELNGNIVTTGAGAATLGNPTNAVAWLANTLGAFGIPLRAGEVILSGSLGAMIPLQRGDHLHLSIGGLGSASVRFI